MSHTIQGSGSVPMAAGEPAGGPQTVVLKKGESLEQMAKASNTTVGELLRANPNIKDPEQVRPGMELRLPARGGDAPTARRIEPQPIVQFERVQASSFEGLLDPATGGVAIDGGKGGVGANPIPMPEPPASLPTPIPAPSSGQTSARPTPIAISDDISASPVRRAAPPPEPGGVAVTPINIPLPTPPD